jgi:hypothetical protein
MTHKIYVENSSWEKLRVTTSTENFTIIMRVKRRISKRYKVKKKKTELLCLELSVSRGKKNSLCSCFFLCCVFLPLCPMWNPAFTRKSYYCINYMLSPLMLSSINVCMLQVSIELIFLKKIFKVFTNYSKPLKTDAEKLLCI